MLNVTSDCENTRFPACWLSPRSALPSSALPAGADPPHPPHPVSLPPGLQMALGNEKGWQELGEKAGGRGKGKGREESEQEEGQAPSPQGCLCPLSEVNTSLNLGFSLRLPDPTNRSFLWPSRLRSGNDPLMQNSRANSLDQTGEYSVCRPAWPFWCLSCSLSLSRHHC